jgi:uncharacterized repeat protein (TIGR01451 family)
MTMRGLLAIVAAATLFALCFAQNASAQIAVDKVTTSPGPNANVTSLTFAHTVGSGPNRILIVAISLNHPNVTATGITYAGKALTNIGAEVGSQNRTEMWYLVAPPSGTADVIINMSAAKRVVGTAISFTGVNQTTPLGTFVGATAQSTAASVTVTSAPGDLVLDTVTASGDANTMTVNASQAQKWNTVSGTGGASDALSGGSTEPGAASVVMSWTLGASKPWSIGAVSLKSGGAAPPNVTLLKSVTPSGNLVPGADLAYTVNFTNGGGMPATSITISDPIPAYTDFKVNTETHALGTTGLGVTVAYSNDNGASWIYAPVSGGGSAPAGCDRNVTNIRWAFSGNLGQTSPNNSGSVGFTTRIR